MFNPYPWQKIAFEKLTKALSDEKHNLVSVAASVGSGKTAVAAYTFGKFIQTHKADKTISMFVAPRISLCNQQINEIETMIFEMFGFNSSRSKTAKEFDYKLWLVNCEARKDQAYKNLDDTLYNKHNIFIICDESLWGTADKENNISRYNFWVHRFNKWEKEGFKFGSVVYDEAHNFDKKTAIISSEDLTF